MLRNIFSSLFRKCGSTSSPAPSSQPPVDSRAEYYQRISERNRAQVEDPFSWFYDNISPCQHCTNGKMVGENGQSETCPYCRGTGRIGLSSAKFPDGQVLNR